MYCVFFKDSIKYRSWSEHGRQCTPNVNIVARSRNYCYHRKAINIMSYELCQYSWPSYPPRKAHAPNYIVICDLSGCTTFSTFSHNRHNFREKIYWTLNVCSNCIYNFCLKYHIAHLFYVDLITVISTGTLEIVKLLFTYISEIFSFVFGILPFILPRVLHRCWSAVRVVLQHKYCPGAVKAMTLWHDSCIRQSLEDASVVSRSTCHSYCQSQWPRLLNCLIKSCKCLSIPVGSMGGVMVLH
jgi:hypothetical protein